MTLFGIIYVGSNKTKIIQNMSKSSRLIPNNFKRLASLGSLLAVTLLVVGFAGVNVVSADQYDEKIRALNEQNGQKKNNINNLVTQAGSYQGAISNLQAQISGLQASLNANLSKQSSVQGQIDQAKAKLEQQKQYLGADIKAMYIDGQLSTIEQLATSKNLSEYVDREEYRTRVQNKIDGMIKEIAVLQQQLQAQKAELDILVNTQKEQNYQLTQARSQQQQLLSYNQNQQAAFNNEIQSNNKKIEDLRRQQVAANARFIGNYTPGSGATCGGGYPAKWCNAPIDSIVDTWGMFNRQCVSYTAFRVAASGRNMPYWGGKGNANQWDDNARRAGIPVDNNPQPGDVAIRNSEPYGHAMYVESVNPDGTINISQYNAAWDGRYSTRNNLSPDGLVFIHFP